MGMMLVVVPAQTRTLVDSLLNVVEQGDNEDDNGREVGQNPPEHFERIPQFFFSNNQTILVFSR